jgi:hypothetical protein
MSVPPITESYVNDALSALKGHPIQQSVPPLCLYKNTKALIQLGRKAGSIVV